MGIEVGARVEEHEDPYVKVIYDMSDKENPQIKVETNTPDSMAALGLLIDGLPYIYTLHVDQIKGKKGVILSPAMAVLPGAKVL